MSNPAARADDPFGRLVGTLVAAMAGAVFVLANTDAFPAPWSTVLRVLAVVAAVALAVGAFVTFRRAAGGGAARGGGRARWGRGYRLVVAGEVVALALGLLLVNVVLEVPRFAIAWVALVVGVHFVVLGRLWGLARFGVLGIVMSALAVLAVVVGAATGSALLIQLFAGVGSGLALLVAGGAAVDLRRGVS